MGDFLLSLAGEGRGIIAETHSESILLRIRRRIAEGGEEARGLDHSDISLLYVDVDSDGNSVVKQLSIDALGEIERWPRGFMEDATEERMRLLAAAAEDITPDGD
jgi:predicted ATPase